MNLLQLLLLSTSGSYLFLLSAQGQVLFSLFAFLDFHYVFRRGGKVHYSLFFFFVYHPYFWSAARDIVICLYHKIPENFMRLIHLKVFWVVLLCGQILILCTIILCSPHNRVSSYAYFALICCMCFSCD